VTTSDFTAPALEYAEQCGILCVDREALVPRRSLVGPSSKTFVNFFTRNWPLEGDKDRRVRPARAGTDDSAACDGVPDAPGAQVPASLFRDPHTVLTWTRSSSRAIDNDAAAHTVPRGGNDLDHVGRAV
ncbi:hypothetical protein ACWD3W_27730, partial [Streptomyces sp. NPDC002644]